MAILKEKLGLTREDLRKVRSMRPGMSIDLQIMSPTGVKRVKTEYIGMDGTRLLILKFPDESRWGNLRDSLYVDSHIVVRYIYEEDAGEVVAFKVKIIMLSSKPGNYLFTTFPMSIQCHVLRSEERSAARVQVTVVLSKTGVLLFDGLIIDLSLSGCRVSANRSSLKSKIPLKENITLAIKNPDGQVSELHGLVMNQKADEISYYFGIKFDASEKEVGELLHQLMLV